MTSGQEALYQRRLREKRNMTEEQKEERRKKNKIARRKYYKKNKKEIRERSSQYKREIRQIAKELGVCVNCGDELDNLKFVSCSNCREKYRKRSKRNYRKKIKNGTR